MSLPDWLEVILLGIIEGVTEFLPISSTGHLLLAQQWLPRQSDLFNVVIQCGAVLAVIVAFAGRLRQLARDWRAPGARDFVLKLLVAFAVTATGGLILKALDFKLPETALPVALAVLIGGVLIILIERWLRGRTLRDEITWNTALIVGLSQIAAAVFPGLSRSGATILAALICGANRPRATEFSFLLGVPTLLAAGAVHIYTAQTEGSPTSENWKLLLLGTFVSALTAFVAVKWLLRFVQTHTFVGFGWYRIVLGVIILAILAI